MRGRRGFTLVELMVALGVSAVLLVCAASAASGVMEAAERSGRAASSCRAVLDVLCWTLEESWRAGTDGAALGWESAKSGGEFLLRTRGAPEGEGVLAGELDSCEVRETPLERGRFVRISLERDRPSSRLRAVFLLYLDGEGEDAP